jgi:hypothetical protein
VHRYGELADELTEIIEELEGPAFKVTSKPLVMQLQRAFNAACQLEREARSFAADETVKVASVVQIRRARSFDAECEERRASNA